MKAGVRRNFMDSGAFSIWKEARRWSEKTGRSVSAYYYTKKFYKYLEEYAAFVKKYAIAIDNYVTIDAILDPETTWDIQTRLENEHGLRPVPVVHYGSDVSWIQKYIDKGYGLIGLGMARSIRKEGMRYWLDQCFDLVCQNRLRIPTIQYHGFGFTSYRLAILYPWYSIDSTVWTQAAGYGNIYIPHYRGGFRFDETPYALKVTDACKSRSVRHQHVLTLRPEETKVVMAWLEYIGVPFGSSHSASENYSNDEYDEVVDIEGVCNSPNMRRKANLLFFEAMAKAQPDWPWPFNPQTRRRSGFGFDLSKPEK